MNTLIKQRLIDKIQNEKNTIEIVQLFELWQQLKNSFPQSPINLFAGSLNDEDAEEIRQIVQSEFQNIEGEW
ncbi:hypothetical protein QUF50_03695 [Thiotrichales bacterium HSG1]|nr:hypothetical protein [Thiotrichales bacterium HSG1]